jgi:hypothetical protein
VKVGPLVLRKLSIASLSVVTFAMAVALLNVGAAGARHHHQPPPTTTTTTSPTTTTTTPTGTTTTTTIPTSTSLLPGETTWSSGAPSYDFGFNNGPEWTEPAFSQLPGVQSQVKAAGLTLDRVWGYDDSGTGSSSSDGGQGNVGQKISAMEAARGTCLFVLGSTNDLTWLKSIITTYGGTTCRYFEFGNEPDNGGTTGNIANEVNEWNANVPVLRSLPNCETNGVPDPNKCAFGGPAVTWSGSTNDLPGTSTCGKSSSGCSNDMEYFLANAKASPPDFVTYHDYPCEKSTSTSACVSNTFNDFQYNYDSVLSDEQTVLGYHLPTGITEYNFDPGSGNLYSWGADDQFLYQWTQAAIDAIVQLRMSFANEYTALDYASYGELDMFCDSAGANSDPACTLAGSPKGQYWGMVSEVEKYGGPSTLTVPNPLP